MPTRFCACQSHRAPRNDAMKEAGSRAVRSTKYLPLLRLNSSRATSDSAKRAEKRCRPGKSVPVMPMRQRHHPQPPRRRRLTMLWTLIHPLQPRQRRHPPRPRASLSQSISRVRGRTTKLRRCSRPSSIGNQRVCLRIGTRPTPVIRPLAHLYSPPQGMHKHFRMIAIAGHMRNHGNDPARAPHTRIPGIWAKLREFYDLEGIDGKEDGLDPVEDERGKRRWLDFQLPYGDFGDMIERRVQSNPGDPPSSPPQWYRENPQANSSGSVLDALKANGDLAPLMGARKRRRGGGVATPKTRSSTVGDTEDDSPVPSPAPRATRGRGGRGRHANRGGARGPKEESGSDPEIDDGSEEDSDGAEEDSEDEEDHEAGAAVSRTRGRGRGGRRGRGGGRSRGRGGRGRGRGG